MTNVIPSCDKYIERFFKIRTKDGRLANLILNKAQRQLYETIKESYGKKPTRIIILKARQLGISTFTEAVITYFILNSMNTDAIIIAHDGSASANIYNMTKLFVGELPDQLKPRQKLNNARLISFDSDDAKGLKSSIRVGVANDSVRGQTYRYAHLSEVAFWEHPEEAMLAILQCVPQDDKSLVVIESTANGFNFFYDLWTKAVNKENDYIPVFFPWYMDDGYKAHYNGFPLSDYEKEIQERYGLTLEQLAWRRRTIANECAGDEARFRQEYPLTPEEAFIASGASVFNNDIVMRRIKDLTEEGEKGYFKYKYDGLHISKIEWVSDPNGFITIYKHPAEPFPKSVCTAIGADTAGDGEDYFAGHVLTREGEQVAVLHHQMDEDLFTKQIYCMAKYYGSMLAVEANFSTYPNMELQRLGYRHLYMREGYDQIGEAVRDKFGFRTTALTRPYIIANLVEIVREHSEKINDKKTLMEMLSFVKLNGKAQAEEGAHDDLVMSLAIGYEAIKQIPVKRTRKRNTEVDDFFTFGM